MQAIESGRTPDGKAVKIQMNQNGVWSGYVSGKLVKRFSHGKSSATPWLQAQLKGETEDVKAAKSDDSGEQATTDEASSVAPAPRMVQRTLTASQTEGSTVPAKQSHLGGLAAKLGGATIIPPHLIIEARAGTGKTTTLIEGLKYMKGLPVSITPSPQQQAVWDQLKLSAEAKSVCFVAFNKSIATELQSRVPAGCEAMTMHSMGFKSVQKQFGRLDVNSYVVQDIISEILEMDIRDLRFKHPTLLKATEELVGLCKQNLIGLSEGNTRQCEYERAYWFEELEKLSSHYDVELNGSRSQVFDLVPKVLERCKQPQGKISFDDMIWLPVVLGLPITKYDLLLVDEAQDLNRCQQALAKKAGKRIILCGDPKQAIYGFAGADSESMKRMYEELTASLPYEGEKRAGCNILPLNVTRRCGKTIVAEAQKIVPDFQAFETNPVGKISNMVMKAGTNGFSGASGEIVYNTSVQDGDFVLCRVNAPLVQQCFRFIKAGRKANIQGRDVAKGLINTVEKLSKKENISVDSFIGKLSDWLADETRKENAKRFPNESKLITLQDRHDCLICFTEGVMTTQDVIAKINSVFTDDQVSAGIKLSSIHKSKGLEAKRVFILQPKGGQVPHPMAKSSWQREQELNLLYVAITRAREELIYVVEEGCST